MTEQQRGVGARGWAAAAAAAAVAALLGARCLSSDPPQSTPPAAQLSTELSAPRPDRPGRRAGARPSAPEAAPAEAFDGDGEGAGEAEPIRCALTTAEAAPHPPLDFLRVQTAEGAAGPPVLAEPTGPGEWTLTLPPEWGRGQDLPGDHLMEQVDPEQLQLIGPTIRPLLVSLQPGSCVAAPLRFVAPLRCSLGPGLAEALAGGEETGSYAIRPALAHAVSADALLIWPKAAEGEVQLHLPDQPPMPLRWTEAGCAPLQPRPTATVEGRVIDPLGGEGLRFVEGCDTGGRVDPDGRFTLTIAADGPCQIEAFRMDGSLRALSEPVAVDPEPDDVIEVTLTLPEEQMAGLGMAFRSLPQGIVAVQVYPDTPAYEAGLRPGDLILEVDGQATAGMSDNDFIAFATGPAGTSVRLLVEDSEGERSAADIRRAAVSR